MQALQIIKTHLILLLCGVFAIGFVVLGVLGMTSETVVAEMKNEISRTGASSIATLKRDPKNEQLISKEKLRGELFETEYTKTLAEAGRINRRKVLMEGVFPEPKNAVAPYEFQQVYKRTMEILYSKLDAGTLPTQAEIEEEAQNVEDLKVLEAEQKAEEEEDVTRSAQTGARGRTPSAPVGVRGRPGGPPTGGIRMGPMAGPRMAPGGGRRFGGEPSVRGMATGGVPSVSISSTEEPKYNPIYRARVSKAKSILCYYDENTFHVSPIAYSEAAPLPEQMWFAQVGLWVQEDVVNAIAELNREAAKQVTDTDACVEHTPVKRLVLLRVNGYEAPGAAGAAGFPSSGTAAVPPQRASLTGRKCNEQYDVVRFVVSVIVDQREILRLIDRLSRVNFYQCLSVSYEAVDQAMAVSEGYFYGTDPVVKATLEFEGYLAREVYQELMPPTVRALLGIKSEGD